MRSRNSLIIFAKAPRICRVKTRLWPYLSHRQCLYIHKQAAQQLLQSLHKKTSFKLVLYITNVSDALNIPASINVKQQSGINLGMRMHHALTTELKTSDRVVLIGTDCLEMDVNFINKAFSMIISNRDIVLSPANDGGYVLVGMRKSHQALFKNINWGTSSVLESTISQAKSLGLTINLTDSLIDVDKQQDLELLYKSGRLPDWAQSLLSSI